MGLKKAGDKREIIKSRYFSYYCGDLPKGCRYCVKGQKLVLFITGLCDENCYFCPVSDKKIHKDVIYANERPISNIKEAIEEAKLCGAKGAGITGGDPLKKTDRCVKYIKGLKKEFGPDFHIHLYTPLTLVTENKIKALAEAGLDELRFHPFLDSEKGWHKIALAGTFPNLKYGVEIPAIPGKEEMITKLIDFIKDKVEFLNINELEISDSNANMLRKMGYEVKDEISYAIKGSEELAMKMLEYASHTTNLNVHYCTAKLKDKKQLANRIKRRAENIATPYDVITPEGTLIRVVLYPDELKPGYSYEKRLNLLNFKKRKEVEVKLKNIKHEFESRHKNIFLMLDTKNLRLITNPQTLSKIKKQLSDKGLVAAVVEEYPTYDSMLIEVDFID